MSVNYYVEMIPPTTEDISGEFECWWKWHNPWNYLLCSVDRPFGEMHVFSSEQQLPNPVIDSELYCIRAEQGAQENIWK
jgi:hypothetical protein